MKKHPYVLFFCTLFSLLTLPAMAGTISGRVWNDTNNNGIRDAGETGRPGVLVLVFDAASRQQRGIASTNNQGTYSVPNVPAGSYIVQLTNPGGVWFVKKNQGTNDAVDSDVNELGFSDAFTVTATSTVTVDGGVSTRAQGCFTPVTLTATSPVCNNNGTPNNPADDTFTFSITATGGTGPWGFDYGTRKMLPYGTPLSVGPFPISGGAVTININDHDNPDCVASIRVTPPATCSTPPAVVTIRCTPDVVVNAAAGATGAVVTFPLPSVSSTCTTGSTTVTRTSGPASGSTFPVGTTQVCYTATDGCGASASCCFNVTVNRTTSVITLNCPANQTVATAASGTSAIVNYVAPTATSTCTTGTPTVTRISGPASGTAFPVGTTQVCFRATDGCGQSTSCCLNVTVNATPEPTPCEVRVNNCARFEVISVRRDAQGDLVYRVRVTNTCSDPLAYVSLEIPQGGRATSPAAGVLYTAPSGRQYTVRNPASAPFTSVRFTPVAGGIAAGQSDIFEYTIKRPTPAMNLSAMMCVMPGAQYSVILQVMGCGFPAPRAANVTDITDPTAAVLVADEAVTESKELGTPAVERGLTLGGEFIVYPNPTTGLLMANLSKWDGQKLTVQVLNSVGQQVRFMNTQGGAEPVQIDMTRDLNNGIYYLQVIPTQGARETQRFVLQR